MTETADFGIAWDWEYDADFVSLLAASCGRRGLSTVLIGPPDLAAVAPAVLGGARRFRAFLDRASDTTSAFEPVARAALEAGSLFVNHPLAARRAVNKAAMHLEFLSGGINVPYTIILPVYEKDPTAQIFKFDGVGVPFIVKPAHGGGGDGVLLGARSIADVMAARRDYLDDQILIQENIVPRILDGRPAYFRVYYAAGDVRACWWNPRAHLSERVAPEEMDRHGLREIERIAVRIHEISGLRFFSTEIAVTADGRFISVDYVNEPCDMRLQSRARDGVPDGVVADVCEALARFVRSAIGGRPSAEIEGGEQDRDRDRRAEGEAGVPPVDTA